MKTETKLARVFHDLARSKDRLDSAASGLLAIVRTDDIRDVKRWDELVRTAYALNGWHSRPGRPPGTKGKAMERVPGTVRTYVSAVRRAMRASLPIAQYRSFAALRADLARTSAGDRSDALPRTVRQSFVGVSVRAPREPNGALFHDLSAVYITLPLEHRDVLGRQLSLLLRKYLPLANLQPRLPAPLAVEHDMGKLKRKAA